MTRAESVELLTWALPRLGLRYRGFRNVRGQVCKRVTRRAHELGLTSVAAYRSYLETHPEEWEQLRALCRVTITRFYRDAAFFRRIGDAVLPLLIEDLRERSESTLRVWSAGCAGGEEAYTLAMIWQLAVPHREGIDLRVEATDYDPSLIARAERGIYPEGALRELPAELRVAFDEVAGGSYRVRDDVRARVSFRASDLTREMPDGPFELILCRNLAFTYFDEELQRETARRLIDRLSAGGILAVGKREVVPGSEGRLLRPFGDELIYRSARRPAGGPAS